jgi:hypothetical protein
MTIDIGMKGMSHYAENVRGKPSLIRVNFGGREGQVIRISEAKGNPKRQKKNT